MKRELLDNGNIWRKTDGRWIGMVRYKDEFGVTKRKSFSAKKKKDLQAKMTAYVADFQEQIADSNESRKPLKESMKNWLRVYKYPEVEHTTYDRYECTAENQIYPYIGDKPVGDITSADIKKLLTAHMNKGLAFTTSKKAYSILKMFFKQLYQEGAIPSNPMAMIDMTKKDNYLAAQKKESKPQCDIIFCKTRSILPADRCFIQIVNQNRKNLFLISVLSVFTDTAYDSSGFQICCLRAVAGGNV